jgi:manganese transport protein
MPHNLYLHSAIVQTRAYGHTTPEKREALKFATIDPTVALMFALVINASILIRRRRLLQGRQDRRRRLNQAQALLHRWGSAIAPPRMRFCAAA